MHELSVCQRMLEQVAAIAAQNGAERVERIRLCIGPLSGVEPPLLAEAFPVASAGGIAEGAELVMETLPVRVHCETCGAESDATVQRLVCGKCGDWRTRLISGDELLLASIEIARETAESEPSGRESRPRYN